VVAAGSLFDDPPDPRAVRAYLGDRRNIFLLATDGDVPVGFLRGTGLRQVHSRRRQMFLYEIAVAPARCRRGVGRALVERFLRHCRRHGYEEAFVFTDPHNTPAVALYRSSGAFTETPADRMFVYRFLPRKTRRRSR
jgi:ribosomal protein S18 acetylase RimI-like enzyme